MRKLFDRYDYLLLPSAQVFPFDANVHWPKAISGVTMDTYHRWMEVVVPGSWQAPSWRMKGLSVDCCLR